MGNTSSTLDDVPDLTDHATPPSHTHSQVQTLLDAFFAIARDPSRCEDPIAEYGSEQWTYAELDCISSGLAVELRTQYGVKPKVASITENHPYLFAIFIAVWKLGGSVAPLDYHAPPEMLDKMLENIRPCVVVVPENAPTISALVSGHGIPVHSFGLAWTITSLTQQFLDSEVELPTTSYPPPKPSSIAVHIHTSSASLPSNLKCVPLSHQSILRGSQSRVRWWKKAFSDFTFNKVRVLGWAPWSHVMGFSHDIGAATFTTGGCYVFAISYTSAPDPKTAVPDEPKDVIDRLIDSLLRVQPDVFTAVPWVIEGLMEKYLGLIAKGNSGRVEADKVRRALRAIKSFGCGGAMIGPEAAAWVREMGLNVFNDIGMTELGAPLFHCKLEEGNPAVVGWPLANLLLQDAELKIRDEFGNDSMQGELVISSKYIAQGYLVYDSSNFSKDPDGVITFKTGDLYERIAGDRIVWKGRKEDYIQLVSSETLDPRPIELLLNAHPAISKSVLVGNNFIRKASDYVLAFIEPADASHPDVVKITKAIATINRTLPPPLRIAWSRVIILENGVTIPHTKKGLVFRKKLEQVFAHHVAKLEGKPVSEIQLHDIVHPPVSSALSEASTHVEELDILDVIAPTEIVLPLVEQPVLELHSTTKKWKSDEVISLVVKAISGILGVKSELLRANSGSSFAEFGMDSNMAVRIVNSLNEVFSLNLPLNACHTFIDLAMLSGAILTELGVHDQSPASSEGTTTPTSTRSHRESADEEIVIVGQALRLPGDIDTPESFWEALVNKRQDIMSYVPEDRWDHASFYRPPDSKEPSKSGDITFEKAGFIDVAHFDNNFFGISAPEAFFVSPTTRLSLETAFQALEDANIPVSKLRGTNMGIFIAAGLNEGYQQLLFEERGYEAYTRFFGTGIACSTACGRLSYLLDVHGPSTTCDTACSSGLVALDQGVKYLQSGEGESAIVAAVNPILWPGSFGFLSAQKMTSVHSRCATFTNMADGYVPSEGAISFILKTKSAALRDNDKILAVVRSTEVAHGGRSQGLVAPNVNAQIALQRSLIAKSGLRPSDIDFVETHGTGTSLGDMIEIQGINEVFQHSHHHQPLVLGAAKSCIGHTETAAGLFGLAKAILSLKNKSVPGLTHLTKHNINPGLDVKTVPLNIAVDTVSLPAKPQNIPHFGLVLANGFAGTLAGAIVESPVGLEVHEDAALDPDGPALFIVSAKTVSALERYLLSYLEFCRKSRPEDLHAICYTTCVGREHYRYRFVAVVSTMEGLIQALETKIANFNTSSRPAIKSIAFAFPGQGSHFQGMAAALANSFPSFNSILLFAATTASKQSGYPITSFLLDSDTVSDSVSIDSTEVSQTCIFVYQYAVSTWLKTIGITPSAVLGHSLGEIAATVAAGALSFDLGLELIIKRAKVLKSEASRSGGMAIVAASKGRIHNMMHQLGLNGRLVIAVYNGEQSHVVSGEATAIDMFLSEARTSGIRAAKLNVAQAFHSPLIQPGLPALQEWIEDNRFYMSSLRLPLYSTAYGSEIPADTRLKPNHWIQHARDPVRFSDAVEALHSNQDIDTILDIGPQPFIWTVLQNLPQNKFNISTTTKKTGDQKAAFLKAVGLLFENGVAIELGILFSSSVAHRKVSLPTYPFQRQRHYPNVLPSRYRVLAGSSNGIPIETLKQKTEFPVDQPLFDLLSHHRIEGRRVSPGAALADFFARSSASKSVKTITFHAPLVLESPHQKVRSEVEPSGRFVMHNSDSNVTKVCTGMFNVRPSAPNRIAVDHSSSITTMTKDQVYQQFKSVAFGTPFRNILELRIYDTHADAVIELEPSDYPILDRIRKLDPCLHMFGAIAPREVPQIKDMNGSFLPTGLEDFTLHSDHIPDSFICRYALPLNITRNYHLISTAVEVISHSGELLLSCRKYSVAWIPAGVVIQSKEPVQIPARLPPLPPAAFVATKTATQHSYTQSWVAQTRPETSAWPAKMISRLLYISPEEQRSTLTDIFSGFADHTTFLHLPIEIDAKPRPTWTDSISGHISSGNILIVLDLTTLDNVPTSKPFTNYHRHILILLQLLGRCRATISNFVVLSRLSIAVNAEAGVLSSVKSAASVSAPNVASVVQGMIRVFRRETSLDYVVWSLDLPSLNAIPNHEMRALIVSEMNLRFSGVSKHRTIAYRETTNAVVNRVVPVLRLSDSNASADISGVSLIVGLGDIGSALATSLVSKGSSRVVFIGRRPSSDMEVSQALARLNASTNNRCSYVQADVCNIEALRRALTDIQTSHGTIQNVIHTAAVIKDASIQNVDFPAFDRVLDPKVEGAWNLHLASQELCKGIKSFVLLSSISVPLGNQGQIAYVAGNFYMEALATYRQSRRLPGVCLHLGAWESRAIQDLDEANGFVFTMDNATGIPLIVNSMFSSTPVQVIAKLDLQKLARIPAYGKDPLFGEILPPAGSASNGAAVTPANGIAGPVTEPAAQQFSDEEIKESISNTLKGVLELRPSDKLEFTDSLISCGIDSISFAQVRGKVMNDLQIEIPMSFLSDSFTIQDMIEHIIEKYRV